MSLDGTSCIRSQLSFCPRNPCDLTVAEHFWYICLSGGPGVDFLRGTPDRTMCPEVDSASESEYQGFLLG